MSKTPLVVKSSEAEEHEHLHGEHFGGNYKVLTPRMPPAGGDVGVSMTRIPPSRLSKTEYMAHEAKTPTIFTMAQD